MAFACIKLETVDGHLVEQGPHSVEWLQNRLINMSRIKDRVIALQKRRIEALEEKLREAILPPSREHRSHRPPRPA